MLDYYMNQIRTMVYTAPVILIAISFHEFAHGYVSYKMGDPTPKRDGRLTLNPFKHLDLMGTLCLLFFHMGWAKPVRINVACYKNRKKGTILVSLAGPVMNFLLAFLSMIILGLLYKYGNPYAKVNYIGIMLAYYSAVINIGLGLFNLIPLPPLDGSNVLGEVFPKVNQWFYQIRQYSGIILVVLLVSGALRRPLVYANGMLLEGMWKIVRLLLGIGAPGMTDIYI